MIDSSVENLRINSKKCASQSPEKFGDVNSRCSTISLDDNSTNNNKSRFNGNHSKYQINEEENGDLFDCENAVFDGLLYKDPNNFSHTMHLMNALRRNRQLCDLILQLDDNSQDIYCHQVVLACNSKFFMEIFNNYEMEQTKDSKIRLSSFDQEIPSNANGNNSNVNNSNGNHHSSDEKEKIPIQQFLNKNHNTTNRQLLLCLSDYLREFLSDNYQHHYAKINNIVSHNSHHHHYHHYHTNNLNHHIDGGIAVVHDEKSHQINHALDYEALKICIDYLYTSQLKVPSYLLPHVYTLAYHLSFESIVQACGQYLIKHLNVDNCLSIRSFALDETLIQASSNCIEKEIEYILQLSPNPIGNINNDSSKNVKSSSGSLQSLTNLSSKNGRIHNSAYITDKKYSSSSSLSSSLNLANIEFNHLPRINIELVGVGKTNKSVRTIDNINELNELCMNWLIGEVIEKQNAKLTDLCDNLNMLYMNNMDHTLHDCCDMNSSDCNFNDLINDYQKKHGHGNHNYISNNVVNTNSLNGSCNNLPNMMNSNNSQNNDLSRRNSSRTSPSGSAKLKTFKITDQELNAIGTATPIKLRVLHANEVICTHQTGESSFITICTLGGKLVTLSVHILYNNNNSDNNNIEIIPSNKNDNTVNLVYQSQQSNESNGSTSIESQFSIDQHNNSSMPFHQHELVRNMSKNSFLSNDGKANCDLKKLPKMSASRCSHGCVAYDNKLYIVGGYDRGECLDLCEVYDPIKNEITIFESMINRRGRAPITWLESQSSIFCVGGSDGHQDLNSIEYYDMKKGKWSEIKFDFELGCTNLGAIACDKYVYLVGLKDRSAKSLSRSNCLRYEPETNSFHRIAPLNHARSQSALVCISSRLVNNSNNDSSKHDNLLFVFGGHDQIRCLNSCEVYSVNDDKWTTITNLVEPRRGCGAAVHKESLCIYIVGGTNGSQSLKSVEIYDIKTKKWSLGPELNVARTNVAIAFIGDILFAVGGFDGKSFLKSIEYLNVKNADGGWSMYHRPDDFTDI